MPNSDVRVKSSLRARRSEAWAWGAGATVVFWLCSWVPSFWTDEAATRTAVERSWSELVDLFGSIDRVHAAYYGLIKVWTDVVGSTDPWALRFPSVVAAGLTVTAVYLLTVRHLGATGARIGATLTLTLPVLAWASTEARSAALVTMIIAWGWVALDSALEGSRYGWVAYATLLALGGWVFLVSVAVAAAHGAAILFDATRRPALRRWCLATSAAAVAVLPLALISAGQRDQVSWVEAPTVANVPANLFMQWFPYAPWYALALAVVFAATAVRRRGVSPLAAAPGPDRWLVTVAITWLLVPTVSLMAVSVLATPVFFWRYLTWTAPGLAVLAAAGLTVWGARSRWTALVVIAATAVTPYLTFRIPAAATKSPITMEQIVASVTSPISPVSGTADWSRAASVISAQARPGDQVAFVPDVGARSPRRIKDSYPDAFAGLDDIGLEVVGASTGELWDSGRPLTGADLTKGGTLWILTVESDTTVREMADREDTPLTVVFDGPQTRVYRRG